MMVLRVGPSRRVFISQRTVAIGWPLGEPLMPAFTDRISQAPDDPFDSIRGPSYRASCLPLSPMVDVQPAQSPLTHVPLPLEFAIFGRQLLQQVAWGLSGSCTSNRPVFPSPNGLKQRIYRISLSDPCRPRTRFVHRNMQSFDFGVLHTRY